MPTPSNCPKQSDYLIFLARLILGIVFVYLGCVKVADPVGFLKMLRQFRLIESSLLLNTIASALPWFEVICGLLLIAGIRIRGTALLVAGMLAGFTAAVALRAIEIYNAETIAFCAIRFDCGCGSGEVLICQKIIENSLLAMLAVAVSAATNHRFCLFARRRPAG